MATSIAQAIGCPACSKAMIPPIMQCLNGHSFCGICSQKLKACKICTSAISSIRNLQLELLIGKVKLGCDYSNKGCKYAADADGLKSHVKECRYRKFECEGKLFCGWKCNWTGSFTDLLAHFNSKHAGFADMEYKGDFNIKMNFKKDQKDLQIIDFGNGAQIFWYKFKMDTSKEKCYWLFQCVAPREYAKHYFYEFEFYIGEIKKLKLTDFCHSDSEDADSIFDLEQCVCVSFQTLSNFIKKNKLSFRFRIMKIRRNT